MTETLIQPDSSIMPVEIRRAVGVLWLSLLLAFFDTSHPLAARLSLWRRLYCVCPDLSDGLVCTSDLEDWPGPYLGPHHMAFGLRRWGLYNSLLYRIFQNLPCGGFRIDLFNRFVRDPDGNTSLCHRSTLNR
jgi:hypothetical protein